MTSETRPPSLTLSWNSVMSHSSASRWLPRLSAPIYLRMFSCLMPGVENTSRSFCHDSLFCDREHNRGQGGRRPARERLAARTWMGKIFTATDSFIIWPFQTQPKRPLAFTSSS